MEPTTSTPGKRWRMSEFTCWNPPRYCQDWQKEMCTFPPRLR